MCGKYKIEIVKENTCLLQDHYEIGNGFDRCGNSFYDNSRRGTIVHGYLADAYRLIRLDEGNGIATICIEIRNDGKETLINCIGLAVYADQKLIYMDSVDRKDFIRHPRPWELEEYDDEDDEGEAEEC